MKDIGKMAQCDEARILDREILSSTPAWALLCSALEKGSLRMFGQLGCRFKVGFR